MGPAENERPRRASLVRVLPKPRHLATLRPEVPWPCRMAPSVRPGGRPSRGVWKPVPALVEPRTFEQWLLKEEHSHQTFGQWRRHRSDVKSGLPSTTHDHVSATQRPPYIYNRRGRGCLLAPSTTRTPPAGTLPPLSSNVCFVNYLLECDIE